MTTCDESQKGKACTPSIKFFSKFNSKREPGYVSFTNLHINREQTFYNLKIRGNMSLNLPGETKAIKSTERTDNVATPYL